jgi:signal recognition particle subunit SEC65
MTKLKMEAWSEKEKKSSNSPFSIYFYYKKTGGDEAKAKKLYEEFLEKKSPFRKKENRPTSLEYWINKGYSESKAKLKLSEFQSKPLDEGLYIKKYGEDEGKIRYENRAKAHKNIFEKEIQNIVENFGYSYDEARKYCCEKRRKVSPRLIEYWLDKGYSVKESKLKITNFQKECSPRSIFHWMKNGYTEEEALEKVSNHQAYNSLESIKKRYDCSLEEAFEIQEDIVDKIRNTNVLNGRNIDKSLEYSFFVYNKEVEYETNKTKKISKLKKPSGYSLDHKFSIKEGFLNSIEPKIIGSLPNLEYITISKNSSKQSKCSITKEELIKDYHEYTNKS